MADFEDNFDEPVGTIATATMAELPEIRYYNKWSCDEVQVDDMSLQVS